MSRNTPHGTKASQKAIKSHIFCMSVHTGEDRKGFIPYS